MGICQNHTFYDTSFSTRSIKTLPMFWMLSFVISVSTTANNTAIALISDKQSSCKSFIINKSPMW